MKYNDSGGWLSKHPYVTCHNCVNKEHIQRYRKSNGDISDGDSSNKPIKDMPEWVTKNNVVTDVEDLETSTITCNNNKYKWCIYCNTYNCAWVFHCKDGNKEWK